ncbi:hypothetical protein BU17DRAFT_67127 [Hysterangium stoloniferum]|nr:hypothetical protein BU17DRAFT_67127 [Hysterangium stoloniferum]
MSTIHFLRNGLENFTEAAFGARPEDIYEVQQWEMAGSHAMLTNGLLNIYQKAATIPKAKIRVFIEYALQWYAAIKHHHDWEESVYYPLYAPRYNIDTIVAAHLSLHAGVEKLKDYLTSCLPAGATWGNGKRVKAHKQQAFDAARFRELVDGFASHLVTHMAQEISHLDPARIRASGFSEEELKHISDVSGNHVKSLPPFTFLVYTIIHTPKSSEFPPVSGFVKNVLSPYVFYVWNRRLWQFAPTP